jgi:hypothetical protein
VCSIFNPPSLFCQDKEMQDARELIHRIRTRNLFAFVGETILTPALRAELMAPGGFNEGYMKEKLLQLMTDRGLSIETNDLFCQIVKIGYGKGNINPVSSLTAFYEPNKSDDVNDVQLHPWNVGVMPEGVLLSYRKLNRNHSLFCYCFINRFGQSSHS